MQTQTSFNSAYATITRDLVTLCEYIDPCEANKNTYSHRTYELFLRTCTELENLWKFILRKNNHSVKEKDWNIFQYAEIERSYGITLSNQEVTFVYWKPYPYQNYAKPFDGWHTCSINQSPLAWYKAYNDVKHDREMNFAKASFENLILSISALHVNLKAEFGSDVFSPQPIPDIFRVSGLATWNHLFHIKP